MKPFAGQQHRPRPASVHGRRTDGGLSRRTGDSGLGQLQMPSQMPSRSSSNRSMGGRRSSMQIAVAPLARMVSQGRNASLFTLGRMKVRMSPQAEHRATTQRISRVAGVIGSGELAHASVPLIVKAFTVAVHVTLMLLSFHLLNEEMIPLGVIGMQICAAHVALLLGLWGPGVRQFACWWVPSPVHEPMGGALLLCIGIVHYMGIAVITYGKVEQVLTHSLISQPRLTPWLETSAVPCHALRTRTSLTVRSVPCTAVQLPVAHPDHTCARAHRHAHRQQRGARAGRQPAQLLVGRAADARQPYRILRHDRGQLSHGSTGAVWLRRRVGWRVIWRQVLLQGHKAVHVVPVASGVGNLEEQPRHAECHARSGRYYGGDGSRRLCRFAAARRRHCRPAVDVYRPSVVFVRAADDGGLRQHVHALVATLAPVHDAMGPLRYVPSPIGLWPAWRRTAAALRDGCG
jgi:hypothetical protein